MNLSDGEKLILIMLADIHKSLKIKNSVDPDLVTEAIHSGNTWGLSWEYPGIFEATEPSKQTVNEISDILDMWTMLEEGFAALAPADQDKVIEDTGCSSPIRFPGFDGNNEAEQRGIAIFLVKSLHRFTNFSGRDLNSHCPSIDAYRRMLPTYGHIREGLFGRSMTASEIIAVLAERTHPSMRKKP